MSLTRVTLTALALAGFAFVSNQNGLIFEAQPIR